MLSRWGSASRFACELRSMKRPCPSISIDLDSASSSDCEGAPQGAPPAEPLWGRLQRRRLCDAPGIRAPRACAGESDEAFARRLQAEQDQELRLDAERCRLDLELARSLAEGGPRAPAPPRQASQTSERSLAQPGSAAPAASRAEVIARVPALPPGLLDRTAPSVESHGTSREPLVYLRNIDGCRGRLIAGRVLDAIATAGMQAPQPRLGQRGGIVVEWHRKKRSQTPWRTGLRVLHGLADEVFAYLRRDPHLVAGMPALATSPGGRPWNDTEVLVTTPGCTLGQHRDAQPDGCLLLIFCVGLSCRSQAWPGGVFTSRTLESGDVMVFDGRRTRHAVPAVLEGTSPFPTCPWLGRRRLAVLVRQQPLSPR